MNTETNFISFENLTKLIEEHKKETHPYKRYEFDSTSYTLLLISINNLIKENQELKKQLENTINSYTEEHNLRHNSDLKLDLLKTQQKEFIKYLEDEKDRLARECSQIYEDSLGKTRLVNEEIFNEVNDILQKYKSIIGVLDEKSNNISS